MHESKTAALLKAVKQSGLEASLSTRGGRTVGQQLVHMHTVRVDLLSKMRRDLSDPLNEPLSKLAREDGHDRALVQEALTASGKAIEQLIASTPDGQVKMFKGGLVTFIAYLIAHESHHRGGMILTLKQTKNPLSKDDYWKIWGWSKASP